MVIIIERSGGFTNILLKKTVNTKEISSDEAVKIDQIISECNFFSLPKTIKSDKIIPDSFQYKLTVEKDNKTYSVEADENALPESLKQLISMFG